MPSQYKSFSNHYKNDKPVGNLSLCVTNSSLWVINVCNIRLWVNNTNFNVNLKRDLGGGSKKILGTFRLVILSMEKTMVAKVISELKSVYILKIFLKTVAFYS